MNYQQTLDFLYSQLPIFQRQGKAAYNKDLGKTIALCKAIGNPQNDLKFIHVAGTNGKGSTCHFLASIFKEAGYKTGLYTSPHLVDFRERCRINGAYIDKDFVCAFVSNLQETILEIQPSFFELTFAMSLAYFKEQKTDIVILETGMGGRLDSTNVVSPELAIITNIGLDHQAYLGETVAEIATEKAGIIKHGIPTLLSDYKKDVVDVVFEKAKQCETPLFLSKEIVAAKGLKPTTFTFKENNSSIKANPPLAANYQLENLQTVAAAFFILKDKWALSTENFIQGIERLQQNFTLFGRWQTIANKPKVICDVGHNEDGINVILEQLKLEEYEQLHIVFGMVNDKNPSSISLLPKDANYHLCKANIPRAMDLETLKSHFISSELTISSSAEKVKDAYTNALKMANTNDLVLVIGSFFVVAEVLELIEN